ncbi:Hrf1 family protein [Trypanosoma rangeli]|uniref:Protein YIF1 n=1 Tax=Trypanosoma rangeli TaxID=5698 RepID=A0A3R7RL55_TRYRA|nr:Hrf1 family protein [Trypanosoma rangeli]RNF06345.1 Hrf1 family protein [Trypanosoma rangeli]|eukprot:RNF06345.1 Hrf1 family protein [Trypanosoma rangeli]
MSAFSPHVSPQQPHPANFPTSWGGDQHGMMLQMGLQYGQSMLQGGEKRFMQHLPVISNVHRYFRVDNNYVKKKLSILLFPFTRRFESFPHGSGAEQEGNGGATGFGGDAVPYSPASTVGRPYPTTLAALPINDVYALDLYLPLMGAITYIILSGFVHGLHHYRVTNEELLGIASAVVFWFLVEVFALKMASYIFRLVPEMKVLDLMALTGYKYLTVSIIVFLRELLQFESDPYYVGFMVSYILFANGVFVIKNITRMYACEGRTPSNARLLAYGAAFLQAPLVLWLAVRPFW